MDGPAPFPLSGVLTLLVTPPPSLLAPPVDASRPVVFLLAALSRGFAASTLGLATLMPEVVSVAALDLVLMKLGRNEERGEAGLAGRSRGDPFGDLPVKPPVGILICVGRLVEEPGRDMAKDNRGGRCVDSEEEAETIEPFESVALPMFLNREGRSDDAAETDLGCADWREEGRWI